MKLCKTEEAVGQILCHDITQIIPGVVKDAVFRKGHVIKEEDIPVLLSVGKEHIYVWENDDTMLHENEAAEVLYEICKGEAMHGSEVKEGKIELIADCDGVLKIDREKLFAVNSLGQMMIAARHGDFPVKAGEKIAGTRIIPLVIEKEKMERAKQVTEGGPIFSILPYVQKKIGLVTTGSEVYKRRIQDKFSPVIKEKLAEYGMEVAMHEICSVSSEMRRDAIVAVIVATICMLLYIWFRFKDIRFASSAVLALLHDVLVVLAFYAIARVSVGNTFIACMLTIVGYSINATIVIFDRIRENLHSGSREKLAEIVNTSITQTLTRSIYTSFTTFVMVAVLYIMGVSSIREFAAPLMVGVLVGAYSSVCITGALWYVMKKKFAGKEIGRAHV